ncbi:MAG: Flp family type IVb pilin [Acidimicrobiales bacterium]
MDIVGFWQQMAVPFRARFGRSERGAALVEYALLLALIAVVCIAALSLLGGNASTKFSKVATSIS